MKFVFSIVSHLQSDLVDTLIDSLDQYLDVGVHQIQLVITHNLPDAGWCPRSKRGFEIVSIRNCRPKGFGDNHNSAFSSSVSDVFLVVNPDVTLDGPLKLEDFVPPQGHVSSPMVFSPEGIVEDFLRLDLTPINLIRRYLGRDGGSVDRFDWIGGMFLVFRYETYMQLKGFDTDYFMYVEDCDLCFRARELGLSLSVLAEISIVHDARRQSGKSFRHMRWHIQSLLLYWSKRARTAVFLR